jgi:hypothetical protein
VQSGNPPAEAGWPQSYGSLHQSIAVPDCRQGVAAESSGIHKKTKMKSSKEEG